jgi:type II secretory pathway pseudopilin PulG
MMSLALVLIGVLLVAILVTATMVYGGSATSKGQAAAQAAELLNQSAQITTASAAYAAEHNGTKPSVLMDLVDGHYLSVVPEGWLDPSTSPSQALTSKMVQSVDTCTVFNAKQSVDGIPLCASLGTLRTSVCCQ